MKLLKRTLDKNECKQRTQTGGKIFSSFFSSYFFLLELGKQRSPSCFGIHSIVYIINQISKFISVL